MKKRMPKEDVPPATVALLAELHRNYRRAAVLGCSPRRFAVPLENLPDTGVLPEPVADLIERGFVVRVPLEGRSSWGLALSAAGEEWAAQLLDGRAVAPESRRGTRQPDLPRWDGRRLYFRGAVVVCLKRLARNQAALLNAFEKAGWTRQIEVSPRDGVAGLKGEQLRQTYSSVNRHLKAAGLAFELSADGKALCWVEVS
jgi:hypothetical protein